MNQGIENILRSKVFQGAKGVKEQSVLRSKVFQGAKGVKKQSVLRSKVFQGVKCSLKQSVLRSKVFCKVFLLSKVFFEAKCASAEVSLVICGTKSLQVLEFLVLSM